MREVVLRPRARAYYRLMSDAEREAVHRGLARLEDDSSTNGRTIFDVPGAPALRLYDDATWRIIFAEPDEATVTILAISHALDLPD